MSLPHTTHLDHISISEEQRAIIYHALGSLSRGSKLGWRDHYCAPDGDQDCEANVAAGLMVRGNLINGGRDRYYFVSDKAKALIGVTP